VAGRSVAAVVATLAVAGCGSKTALCPTEYCDEDGSGGTSGSATSIAVTTVGASSTTTVSSTTTGGDPACGDGVVDSGECCDFAVDELCDSACCCLDDCGEEVVFVGLVTDDRDPTLVGPGVSGTWAYGGFLGLQAGNAMCQAMGADHVCGLREVTRAANQGQLASVPDGSTIWIHRLIIQLTGFYQHPVYPHAESRCGDWTDPGGVEGEYCVTTGGIPAVTLDLDGIAYDGDPACAALRAIPCCNPACPPTCL
jgi:hypothetical protein